MMATIQAKLRLLTRSKHTKRFITLVPFLMLLITLITTFIRLISGYSEIYLYLSQIMGYSILTNLYMLWNAIRNKYCDYSIVSISSLLLLNVSNIIAMAFGFENNEFYILFDAILIVYLFKMALMKFLKSKHLL